MASHGIEFREGRIRHLLCLAAEQAIEIASAGDLKNHRQRGLQCGGDIDQAMAWA